MSNFILSAENISKSYNDGNSELEILKCLDLKISKGEKIAILGSSGSGKSTLLHLLAGLDMPNAGYIKLEDKIINDMSSNQLASMRNKSLGFIYQFHHLLPEFTAQENIAMPLLIAGFEFEDAMQRSKVILIEVGLRERASHKPSQLSGGERQRVAIARAMINKPKCILADEPTGNLDEVNAINVLNLLLDLNKNHQTAMVLVTHDRNVANKLDKTYVLNHGQLELLN